MNATRPSVLWLATLAAVVVVVALLHGILLPFVAGIALAYLLNPVVNGLARLGLNRTVAALGIISVFIIGVGVLVVLAIPIIGEEVATFIEKVPVYIRQLQAFATDPSRPWLRKIVGEGVNEAQQSMGELATLDRSVPVAQRETVRTLSREIDDTLAGFLRGQGTICLILALYYASALRLIGLNHGLLIGLVAGLISFIPYLGSLIGLVLSLCVVVLQFWPNWTMIPVVLGIFVAGQAIADYALAPYLIASRINLNPVWVMFAIAAFGYLFGFVGLLIAVPLAAAIGVVVRFAVRQYQVSQLDPATVVSAPEPSRKKTSFWRRWREKT
jgi:predicted PurR-regulated permease PerM